MRLTQLDAATRLEDLKQPPSNRLEALKGDRKGQWSIRINDQWRVCFKLQRVMHWTSSSSTITERSVS